MDTALRLCWEMIWLFRCAFDVTKWGKGLVNRETKGVDEYCNIQCKS